MNEKEKRGSIPSDVELYSSGRLGMFEYQAPVVLNQATPGQNIWYTILDTTKNVRVYFVAVNIEDANETLEVQVTVDGETIVAIALAATHSTGYFAFMAPEPISGVNRVALTATGTLREYRSFFVEGRSVKIEARKTTALGAGNLTGIATYGVLKDAR